MEKVGVTVAVDWGGALTTAAPTPGRLLASMPKLPPRYTLLKVT